MKLPNETPAPTPEPTSRSLRQCSQGKALATAMYYRRDGADMGGQGEVCKNLTVGVTGPDAYFGGKALDLPSMQEAPGFSAHYYKNKTTTTQ